MLTVDEWQRLLVADGEWAAKEAQNASNSLGSPPSGPTFDSMRYRAIYKLWPDFPVQSQIYRSVATVKADAAFKSFGAAGAGIVWAVIDSGIDKNHQHFDVESGHALLSPEVRISPLLRRQRVDIRWNPGSGAGANRSGRPRAPKCERFAARRDGFLKNAKRSSRSIAGSR
jgi:hypothetical protein